MTAHTSYPVKIPVHPLCPSKPDLGHLRAKIVSLASGKDKHTLQQIQKI